MCTTNYDNTLVIVSMLANVVASLLIVLVNLVLFYFLSCRNFGVSHIERLDLAFKLLNKAAIYSTLPMVAILIMAESVGLTKTDLVNEYQKESNERRLQVYRMIGQNMEASRFLETFPSQFMLHGFAGEQELLTVKSQKSKKA